MIALITWIRSDHSKHDEHDAYLAHLAWEWSEWSFRAEMTWHDSSMFI